LLPSAFNLLLLLMLLLRLLLLLLLLQCKILGETLNTVVSTLVAGSFVTFMPWQIFWLW
jgi:hypothetical protein